MHPLNTFLLSIYLVVVSKGATEPQSLVVPALMEVTVKVLPKQSSKCSPSFFVPPTSKRLDFFFLCSFCFLFFWLSSSHSNISVIPIF